MGNFVDKMSKAEKKEEKKAVWKNYIFLKHGN